VFIARVPVPLAQKASWASEVVGTKKAKEKSLAPTGQMKDKDLN
jgi:hypothetical protein